MSEKILLAQSNKNVTGVIQNEVVAKIQDNILTEILNPILGLATAIAFILFIYGGIKFLLARSGGDSSKLEAGKWHIIWGSVGLFVLLSLWGILTTIGTVTDSNIWFVK